MHSQRWRRASWILSGRQRPADSGRYEKARGHSNRMLTGDLQGVWWLPESPDHTVPGTLTLAHEARPKLVVIGSIDPNLGLPASIGTVFGHTRDLPLVFGRTAAGQLVTLADARFALRQMHIEDAESAVFELVGRAAYVGAHVDPRRATFSELDLGIERLTDWRDPQPFHLSMTPSERPRRIGVSGDVPEVVHADLDGGALLVDARLSTSGDFHRQASLSLDTSLNVRLDHGQTMENWLEAYAGPLQRLVALATGRAIEIERMELSEPSADLRCEVVWPRKLRASEPEGRLMPDELLFTVTDLGDRISEHLSAWLSASRRLEPVMNMFFATRYADAMFEEDRFQNLVQAAEAYHRRIAGARPDQAAHDARSAAVLAAVPEAHHEWLGEVLETAKEYRLSDRIEALLELHDWMRGDVVPRNVHRWAGRVAMARNYRAHQDPGGAADRNDLPRTRGTDPAPDCLDRSLSTPRDRLRGGSPPRDGAAGKPCVPTPEAQPDLVAVSRIRQSIGASMGRPRSAEYRGAGQPGHSGRSRWFDSSRPDQTHVSDPGRARPGEPRRGRVRLLRA